jgi:hypothetical protein
MKHQKKSTQSSYCLEPLENRKMMSVSPTVHADTTFATTTSLTITSRKAEIGQSVTIKGVISSTGGIDKGATAELLDGASDTGLTATVNHLGYVTFSFGPSNALYLGTQLWRIRVLTHGNFVGSKSRQLTAKVVLPALTTASDGLEVATVTKGSGAAAKAGESVNVQYTGFNAANGGEFDESSAHGATYTLPFVLDASPEAVIPGFDQEVTGMKVGETRIAYLPAALAYSNDPNSSLNNDNLVFVVRLVSIT